MPTPLDLDPDDTIDVVVDFPYSRTGGSFTFTGRTVDGTRLVTFLTGQSEGRDIVAALFEDVTPEVAVPGYAVLYVQDADEDDPFEPRTKVADPALAAHLARLAT